MFRPLVWKYLPLLLLTLAINWGVTACQFSAKPAWQEAVNAPKALLKQVMQENYLALPQDAPLNPERMRMLKMHPIGQNRPLYLFDFRTDGLCGVGGCLLVGYISQNDHYRSVLQVLVPPPDTGNAKESPISIVTAPSTAQGMPCLAISRLPEPASRWCDNGQSYQWVQP